MAANTTNGWKTFKLSDAIRFFGGNAFKSTDACDSGVRWLKIANVGFGEIDWSNLDFLPSHFSEEYKKYLLKENDIVMALTRPILHGRLKIAKLKKEDSPALLNQRVAKLIANEGFSLEFLYYVLSQRSTVMKIENVIAGTDPPNLSFNDLKNVNIVAPVNFEEQQKIATILATWDKAIELKEELIEEKQKQKKGLMQKLLTGEVRLPGFTGEWKTVKLGDIAEIYQPKTISQKDLKESGYPVYGANGLIGYYDRYNHETWQIMITCRGSTCGTVNKTNGKAWITGNAMVVNVDKNPHVDKHFIYYLCYNQNYERIIGGSGQPQITKKPLENYPLYLPFDIHEQAEIAKVFLFADQEIDLLKKELSELKQQKQGLMQQLLTGKVRLQV